jgi:hypothetical protein
MLIDVLARRGGLEPRFLRIGSDPRLFPGSTHRAARDVALGRFVLGGPRTFAAYESAKLQARRG